MLGLIKADMPWEILCTLSFTEPPHVDLWRHTVDIWFCVEQRLPHSLLGNTWGGEGVDGPQNPSYLPFDMYYRKTELVRNSLRTQNKNVLYQLLSLWISKDKIDLFLVAFPPLGIEKTETPNYAQVSVLKNA